MTNPADLRTIRFTYTDPSGVIRSRATTGATFAGKVSEGVGLTRAQQAVNVFEDYVAEAGLEPVGEVRLVPDLETLTQGRHTGVARAVPPDPGLDRRARADLPAVLQPRPRPRASILADQQVRDACA